MQFSNLLTLMTVALSGLSMVTAEPIPASAQLANVTQSGLEAGQPSIDACQWGNWINGQEGWGCYCASGCRDPSGVCDLMFGECHKSPKSSGVKAGVTALGVLMTGAAITATML